MGTHGKFSHYQQLEWTLRGGKGNNITDNSTETMNKTELPLSFNENGPCNSIYNV